MRYASRGGDAPPPSLSARDRNGRTELDRARIHAGNPDPAKKAFKYEAYKSDEVRLRLEALFHGKCAYCETFYAAGAPMDVEHYRPKGQPEGDPTHPGYWWLAARWDNLLPSCIDCNRRRGQVVQTASGDPLVLHETGSVMSGGAFLQSGKQSSFPVDHDRCLPESLAVAAEGALLLDPCRDSPDAHLVFFTPGAALSLIVPRAVQSGAGPPSPSRRGGVSVEVYGLNRARLIQDRTRLLRRLEFQERILIRLASVQEQLADPALAGIPAVAAAVQDLRLLEDMVLDDLRAAAAPHAPYSAVAKAWLSDFLTRWT